MAVAKKLVFFTKPHDQQKRRAVCLVITYVGELDDLGAKRNAEVTALKSAQHNLMWQKLPEMTWQGCNCKQLGHIVFEF